MNALAPPCSCRISPPSTLPIQGEPAARPGLKFPVNFLVLINLGAVSKVKEDHNTIHGELHNLGDESKGNGMKFKTTKCKVMHLGINKKFCSKLGADQLETREEQRDVSVLVNQRMAMSHQGVALWKSRSLRVLQVKHSQFRPVALQWCHGQDFTWGVLCMENVVLSTGKNGQGNKEGLRKDLEHLLVELLEKNHEFFLLEANGKAKRHCRCRANEKSMKWCILKLQMHW